MQMIANALDTVASNSVISYLENYLEKEKVKVFVIGYPKQLNNKDSESVKYLKPFLVNLRKKFPNIPIEMVDERFTSKIAFRTMIDVGLKKKQRQNKATVDKISATIILQSYMEKQRNLAD